MGLFDSIVSGLGSLFGAGDLGSAAGSVLDSTGSSLFADPSFSLGVSPFEGATAGGGTDIAGNLVGSGNSFNSSGFSLTDASGNPVTGIDGTVLNPPAFGLSGGQVQPLGFVAPDGSLVDASGNPITPSSSSAGSFPSSSLPSLSGGAPSGGSGIKLSMPSLMQPQAANIPMATSPPMMTPPAMSVPANAQHFTPMSTTVPLPSGAGGGLSRVFGPSSFSNELDPTTAMQQFLMQQQGAR